MGPPGVPLRSWHDPTRNAGFDAATGELVGRIDSDSMVQADWAALEGLKVGYAPAMIAGISARRLDTAPRDYLFYVERFERTYRAHGIHDAGALAPMAVLIGIYPALHLQRRIDHKLHPDEQSFAVTQTSQDLSSISPSETPGRH